jgi:hypothetical protein
MAFEGDFSLSMFIKLFCRAGFLKEDPSNFGGLLLYAGLNEITRELSNIYLNVLSSQFILGICASCFLLSWPHASS